MYKQSVAAVEEDQNDKVRCDACPIRCFIRPGRTGSCDRYGNVDGVLTRVDPLTILERQAPGEAAVVPFGAREWEGHLLNDEVRITGIGAGTTYPDYKPAPFIVSSQHDGVDVVTVVTEGIFSYCGVKVKIDTDRHVGHETATIRVDGAEVGHVTTAEYGSQMLSIGGVNHLTGQGRRNGLVTCQTLLDLCLGHAVELEIDGGTSVVIEAGRAPIIGGTVEQRMRVGCGSATIGMFATQWAGLVDDVVVIDDHITGVMSEHQAGKVLDVVPSGIKLRGRKSTPGRYFEVSEPGAGWGGTCLNDPLEALDAFDGRVARPGQTLLMVSTTGDHAAYFVLDEALRPVEQPIPAALAASIDLISENCEPATASVVFMAGAGGSLRAGATTNPVRLTRSIRSMLTRLTCGGAPAYIWPGGGITLMVDVTRMPANAFGSVPTPALVAPIEFTMARSDYEAIGGHMGSVVPLADVLAEGRIHRVADPDVHGAGGLW
ncbi:MAG: 6-hydroxynicotinate reductase [Acidimicrobiales bacterium]|nr:6-hydroxynicotinate reductase [Acidimicrobiales bacterium]